MPGERTLSGVQADAGSLTDDLRPLYERLLVLRCQTGDPAAFAELIDTYAPRLRYYLSQLARKPHLLDDLLQEVWIEVFRSLPRLNDPVALPAWLYRIARNRAYRDLRRPRLPVQHLDAGELSIAADEETFDGEDAEQIHAALARLALEHREVLLLRFLEEMSYEQIAAVVGCELGTVKSRIHYAKRALREILERTAIHE